MRMSAGSVPIVGPQDSAPRGWAQCSAYGSIARTGRAVAIVTPSWCRSDSCTCRPRRGRLAWGQALARAVLGVYVRVLLGFQRHRARRSGMRDGRSGCVTVIERFGGRLNLNIHFHTLLFDGVFHTPDEEDPPTDDEVGVVLERIAARVQHLLKGRGLGPIPWSKNLRPWPGSAAPRFRGESRSVLVRARACGAWGTIPTHRGCSPRPPGTPI